jgi:hypothetical protein
MTEGKKYFLLLNIFLKNEMRGSKILKNSAKSRYYMILLFFFYLMTGLYFTAISAVYSKGSPFTFTLFFMTILFFMTMMLLLLELRRFLIMPEDSYILLRLPIKTETILLGKVSFIFLYTFIISFSMGFLSLFAGYFLKGGAGILGILGMLVVLFFNSVAVTLIASFLFLGIISIFNVTKFDKIIVYFSTIFTIGVYIFYVYLIQKEISLEKIGFIRYLPTYYFARLYEYIYTNNFKDGIILLFSIITICLFLIFLLYKLFSKNYERYLKNYEKKALNFKNDSNIHNANPISDLIAILFKREHELRTRTFSTIGILIAFILLSEFKIFSNESGSSSFSFIYFIVPFILYIFLLVFWNTTFSKDYKAAYIFKLSPIGRGKLLISYVDGIFNSIYNILFLIIGAYFILKEGTLNGIVLLIIIYRQCRSQPLLIPEVIRSLYL